MRTFGRWFSADAAGGGDAAVVVEAAPAAEASSTPEAAPAAPVEAAAPESKPEPAPAWNGEIEHLAKQEWFTALPEEARKGVEGGVREKVKNLESGYGKKFNEVAEARKAWEAEKADISAKLTKASEDAELFQSLVGDVNGEEVQKRIEAARLEAAKPYEEKLAALSALEAEIKELRTYKQDVEAREKAAYEARVEAEAATLKEKVADILTNVEAMDKLERLVAAGETVDDAVAYVKRRFNIKPPVMPESAVMASRGDGPAGQEVAPKGLTLDQRIQWSVDNAARKLGYGA